MPSSSGRRSPLIFLLTLAIVIQLGLPAGLPAGRALAQQPAPGFAVERFYPSAPGGGWLVMDTLDLSEGLGGALALTLGYAHDPLRVSDGTNRLAVVSDQAFADVGAAVHYGRARLYLDLAVPLVALGQSGTVGDYAFTAPSLTLASHPDTISDARVGVDVLLVGVAEGRFRLGAGAQLLIPSGNRADYQTDGTVRGMLRLLLAGDLPHFTWAAQLGVHLRPLDDTPVPGSPQGSELLFGAAGGVKLRVGEGGRWAVVLGPELFGATPFASFLDGSGAALEGLLSARIEGTAHDRLQLRVKLGAGGGLLPQQPEPRAPEWRVLVGVEMFHDGRTKPRGSLGQPTPLP